MLIVCSCSKTEEKDKKTKESDVSADGQNIEENKEDSIDTDTTETFMKEETVQKYTSAYLEVIESVNGNQYKYAFAYINEDDIPELIVKYPYSGEQEDEKKDSKEKWNYSFYSYNPKDEKIYAVDIDKAFADRSPYSELIYYNERTGTVRAVDSNNRESSNYIYEIVFDKLWEAGRNNAVIESSHDIILRDNKCFWDSEECSIEEYGEKLDAFDAKLEIFRIFERRDATAVLECLQNEYKDSLLDWKKSYMFYIFMNGYIEYHDINFINIDGDDTPELFFLGEHANDMNPKLLCYSGEQLYFYELDRASLYYIEGENLFYQSGGKMENFYDVLYSLENGNLIEKHRGWYGCYDTSVFDENNEIIFSYEWNGEEVSKEGYEKLLEKYFDKDAASRATGKYNLTETLSVLGSDEEIKTDSDSYSSNETEFDASAYVQSCLDLLTKGETEDYMKMTKRTQIQAEDDYEKNLNAMVESMGVTGISAQLQEDYKMFFKELYKKSKYTVKNAEKMREKDGYLVTVEIEQITGLFNGLSEELDKKTKTFDVDSMTYDEITELVFDTMLDLMNRRLNKISYAVPKDITVEVEADVNKVYSITNKGYEAINEALISVEGLE